MSTDKLDIGNAFMIVPNTGDRIELNGIQKMTIEAVEPIDIEPIKTSGEIEISMDVEKISRKTLLHLMYKSIVTKGSPEEIAKGIFRGLPLEAKIQEVELRQNRTHKKHRINKKWAKRYGYTCTVYYV